MLITSPVQIFSFKHVVFVVELYTFHLAEAVNVQEDVKTRWALPPVAPPPVPMGQLQGHQPGTNIHQRFAPLILKRLLVAEQ